MNHNDEILPVAKKKSVVEGIQDWIVNQIIKGTLKPGDKLPTETELSQILGVGRNSVREAIKILQAYGVIYIKRAEGTYIAQQCEQNMLAPFLYGLILQDSDWRGFIDLRRAVDIGLLYIVARQEKNLEDMAVLHRALAHLEATTGRAQASIEDIQKADSDFHRCLAEISHNSQLVTLADYIDRLTIPTRIKATELIMGQGKEAEYIHLHQQIVHIVEASAVSEIEDTVNSHYYFWIKKDE